MSLENYSFTDNNGDGVGDVGAADLNGDGVADAYALDTNFDGYVDTYQLDANGDQYFESIGYDNNLDGVADALATDTNLDGRIDTTVIDSDQNRVAETMLVDRDGDGVQEMGLYDSNQDGRFDSYTTPETGNVALQDPSMSPVLESTTVGGGAHNGTLDAMSTSPVLLNSPYATSMINQMAESQKIAGQVWTLPDNFELVKRNY
ncbi:hypothetical protein JOE31_001294 [Arthrobacter sp. PvP023]|uniref:hypothetical protein n=1 Tax=Micrococcaceae TaxID=1268 RepID=UPI001AEA99AC|nr:hypothetical protein [Arthrobacter sp. PvP023]MBP1135062.1 hypothetical protein [Arthrobacter sp. PvP023]